MTDDAIEKAAEVIAERCGVAAWFARRIAQVLADAGLLPTARQQWGWGSDGWTPPGSPDNFMQPMTHGHDAFTEDHLREAVARLGGIAVVRTVFTAPDPTPWKDAS